MVTWLKVLSVVVDRTDGSALQDCRLRVGVRRGPLFPGGPPGVVAEVVELSDPAGSVLVLVERPPPARGELRRWPAVLLVAAQSLAAQGLYPRVAALHNALEVTGLSWETGGWVDGRALRYEDPVRTAPDGTDGG